MPARHVPPHDGRPVTTSEGACARHLAPSLGVNASHCCAQQPYHQLLLQLEHVLHARDASDLFSHGAVRDVVRQVGLQPSDRTVSKEVGSSRFEYSVYGEEAQYQALRLPHKGKRADLVPIGMWQVPQQFECLMTALASAAATGGPMRRSVCVGTWSGWTDVLMAAYLRRLDPHVSHATFDVRDHTSPCIKSIFGALGVRHVRHGWYGGTESWPALGLGREWDGTWPANFSKPVLDFCLIDGGHSYHLAHRDFRTLRSACRVIAFHDIVNVPRVGRDAVPRLWQELTTPSHPNFASEFAAQNCTHQPKWSDGQFMGIGILKRVGNS